MKTYKQVERALANAERRVDEWQDKLDGVLTYEYCALLKNEHGMRFATLIEVFSTARFYDSEQEPLKVSNVVEAIERYPGNIYHYVRCGEKLHVRCAQDLVRTQTVINRIAKAENKLNNWNAIRYWLETLLDNIDEHGNARLYCEETYAEAVCELNKLGFSI